MKKSVVEKCSKSVSMDNLHGICFVRKQLLLRVEDTDDVKQ